jgi:hypothetical protein
MPGELRLWHYIRNSGNVAETGRDECDQAAIDLLLPIVDAQEGDLPSLGLGIDIMAPIDEQRHRVPGAAFFQIEPAGERMSCCSGANRARSRSLSATSPLSGRVQLGRSARPRRTGGADRRRTRRGLQDRDRGVTCSCGLCRGSRLVAATHP